MLHVLSFLTFLFYPFYFQISKWFENARRSVRLSSREGNKVEGGTTNNVLAEANGLDPDSKNGGGVEKNVTKSF